jgi:uncharacterized protein (DUF983 family)
MEKPARCTLCGTDMKILQLDKYNKPHGFALMAIGVVIVAAIPAEALLSLVLLPFGLVVAFSKKEVWSCPSCFSLTERLGNKQKYGW